VASVKNESASASVDAGSVVTSTVADSDVASKGGESGIASADFASGSRSMSVGPASIVASPQMTSPVWKLSMQPESRYSYSLPPPVQANTHVEAAKFPRTIHAHLLNTQSYLARRRCRAMPTVWARSPPPPPSMRRKFRATTALRLCAGTGGDMAVVQGPGVAVDTTADGTGRLERGSAASPQAVQHGRDAVKPRFARLDVSRLDVAPSDGDA
jgi:hypothetical protein